VDLSAREDSLGCLHEVISGPANALDWNEIAEAVFRNLFFNCVTIRDFKISTSFSFGLPK